MQDELAACLEYYQKSKNMDVSQRSHDFKQLAKYNAALRKSGLVNFDENLAFLDSFVQQTRLKGGCREYDKNKSLKTALGGGGNANFSSGGNNDQRPSQELIFEYKPQDRLQIHKPLGKDEEVIKVKGDTKWGADGYKEAQENTKAATTIINQDSSK